MSLLSSVFDTLNAKAGDNPEANPLVGMLGNLLAQSGGLEGLMNKFSQAGLGNAFSSWVGTGPNQPISADQIQKVLGSDQVKGLAAKLGIDPGLASQFLAEHLPNTIDRLTPEGRIDPNANIQQTLAGLVPLLLGKLTASTPQKPPPA